MVPATGRRSPPFPVASRASQNPIDAFIGAVYREKGLHPSAKPKAYAAAARVLRSDRNSAHDRRAGCLSAGPISDAYEKVVDRLLADEQHGVRWARHWLDVLRYADLDGLDGSVMPAAASIYLWRDWVIVALNHDMPYDEFVRAQILGNRYRPETATTAPGGRRSEVEGPVADTFALGFLARAAVNRERQGSRHSVLGGGNHLDGVHGHDRRVREVPRS